MCTLYKLYMLYEQQPEPGHDRAGNRDVKIKYWFSKRQFSNH
jgi:hypothetical protein